MKLYYSPGSCSLAAHIVLRETGQTFDLVKVDGRAKTYGDGKNYYDVSPNGYVPALQFDDGQVLTEVPAVLQYVADQHPEVNLAPPPRTLERSRLHEWLGFIGTELHKGFGPLFNPAATDEFKATVLDKLGKRFGYLDQQLSSKTFLLGDQFTVADAYGYTVATWTDMMKIDRSGWPNLQSFMDRIAARPHVKEARRVEDLT